MKKIFYSLALFVTLFLFSSKVEAISCIYKCEGCDDKGKDIVLGVYDVIVENYDGGVEERPSSAVKIVV